MTSDVKGKVSAKDVDDTDVQNAVEDKLAAKKAAKAKASANRKDAYTKYRDNMKNPHVSNEAFCAAAWFAINNKGTGVHQSKVTMRADVDAQRDFLAYRKLGPITQ